MYIRWPANTFESPGTESSKTDTHREDSLRAWVALNIHAKCSRKLDNFTDCKGVLTTLTSNAAFAEGALRELESPRRTSQRTFTRRFQDVRSFNKLSPRFKHAPHPLGVMMPVDPDDA
jgi:hypothetical protein